MRLINTGKTAVQFLLYLFYQMFIVLIKDIEEGNVLTSLMGFFLMTSFLENMFSTPSADFSTHSNNFAMSSTIEDSASTMSLVCRGVAPLVATMTKTISFKTLQPLLIVAAALELIENIPKTSGATIEVIADHDDLEDHDYFENDDFVSNNPSRYENVPYRGINLSGFEWGPPPVPPTLDDATYFINVGMNTIRLPFKWEYFQPDLSIPINFNEGLAQQYVQMVTTFTNSNISVIVDMHNYMLYNNQIIGQNGSIATTEDYADTWAEIASQFQSNHQVLFDLMNEPNTMPTELILTNYNAAIAAIRATGSNHTLLLEGNAWSGLAHWNDNWYGTPNSVVFVAGNIKDIFNNFVINVHEYLNDPGGGGNGYGDCVEPSQVMSIEKFSDFIQWLQTQSFRAFLTEMGGEATQNCIKDLDIFLTNIELNSHNATQVSGFIGWTLWSGGSFDPSSYVLSLAPYPNGTEKPQMNEAIDHHLRLSVPGNSFST